MNPALLEPPSEDVFDDEDEQCTGACSDDLVDVDDVVVEAGDVQNPIEHITKDIFDECEDFGDDKEVHSKVECSSVQGNIDSHDHHCCPSSPSSCFGNTGDNQSCHSTICDKSDAKRCKELKCKIRKPKRARSYQEGLWMERYQELVDFHQKFGHSCVPTRYADNPELGLWVKRQRNQYKLLQQQQASKSKSTLTLHRIKALNRVDFVWEVRDALWTERYNELRKYYLEFGDSNVPSTYAPNQALASWVKSQRHQQQLYSLGRLSTMTNERKDKLDSLDFQWRIIGNNDSESLYH